MFQKIDGKTESHQTLGIKKIKKEQMELKELKIQNSVTRCKGDLRH